VGVLQRLYPATHTEAKELRMLLDDSILPSVILARVAPNIPDSNFMKGVPDNLTRTAAIDGKESRGYAEHHTTRSKRWSNWL
jgi:hypothetical protein